MSRKRLDRAPCPIARTTGLAGDAWTPLLLRNVCFGQRRFDELQRALRVPRASLTRRLARLVDEGLLERRPYQDRPPRYEYHLTAKGRAFFDVLAAMWRFGEDWLFEDRAAPVTLVDRRSGRTVRPIVVDEATRAPLELGELRARLATGALRDRAGS
jgi:DNA-binding HxlR family transcriptional regulator